MSRRGICTFGKTKQEENKNKKYLSIAMLSPNVLDIRTNSHTHNAILYIVFELCSAKANETFFSLIQDSIWVAVE